MTWAQRLKRVFSIDIEVCGRCSGSVRVIACIEDQDVTNRILAGEVRWLLPSNDERSPWMAGFQILKADDSDVERWVALVASMESA